MRVIIGANHRGYLVREVVVELLQRLGHDIQDLGAFNGDPVDYPDIAARVAHEVSGGQAERGILVGGTCLGMCIVANKFPGVRAVLCHDDLSAELSRRQIDANVLCLSADNLHDHPVDRLIQVWLNTAFVGGRYARHVAKIAALERMDNGTDIRRNADARAAVARG